MQQKVEQDSFNEKRRSKQDLSHSDALGMRVGQGKVGLHCHSALSMPGLLQAFYVS